MFRSTRVLVSLVLALLLVAGGLALFAQAPDAGGRRGGPPDVRGQGPMVMLPLRQLGLSDAQQQQVRQLMQQFREQSRTLVDQVRAAEDARRTAVEAVPVDEGRIRAAMQQLFDRQTELAIQQARLHSDIRALLTSEQQQQLDKLRAEREARFKQRQERVRERQRNQV